MASGPGLISTHGLKVVQSVDIKCRYLVSLDPLGLITLGLVSGAPGDLSSLESLHHGLQCPVSKGIRS